MNSILSGNSSYLDRIPDDCSGKGGLRQPIGYNILGTALQCSVTGDDTGTIYTDDPQLGPLSYNGGPSGTRAPLDGSPAIDAGNPETPGTGIRTCRRFDQRRVERPRDGDGDGTARCDIGAHEK
jgi:hypothetical protein